MNSNFSFDLWIILHKKKQTGKVSHRKQYLSGINNAYSEKFKDMSEYKKEKNFKRILSHIQLEDVITATKNGNLIRKNNELNLQENCRIYGNFKYYTENPDMTINECIEQILKECKII